MTNLVTLTDAAWTDLGPTPLVIELAGDQPAAYLAATSAPVGIGVNSEVLGPGQQIFLGGTGRRVYGRAAPTYKHPTALVRVGLLSEFTPAKTSTSPPQPVDLKDAGARAAALEGIDLGTGLPTSGSVVVPPPSPTLGALTVSASGATVGSAYTGTISGRTPGSSLALSGPGAAGLTLSGTTISGSPTATGAVDVVETLAGATNNPRTSSGLVTVAAAGATFSGVVANRGAIASRSTVTPAAGVLSGNNETQHTLTATTRWLELVYDNITTDGGAGIINTGLPAKTMTAGVRLRPQTGVAAQTIIPAYVEALHEGIPGSARAITMTSGQEKSLYVDLGQEYPAGLSLLIASSVAWPTTPARYAETDTLAAAFNELNEFGPSLADKSTANDATWSGVGKVTSYSPNVPRMIRGHKLASKPKSFAICGDSKTSAGATDSASNALAQGYIGWLQKALGSTYGWFNVGCTGLSIANVRSNPARLQASITWMLNKGVTHAVCAWGDNDHAANRSPAAYLADVAWLRDLLAANGIILVVCTLTPRPDGAAGANYNASQSTNALDVGYAAANGGQASWQGVNAKNVGLRSGAYGPCIDAHAAVADPNDSTKWRTDLATPPSGDLVHPNGFFHGVIRDVAIPVLLAA